MSAKNGTARSAWAGNDEKLRFLVFGAVNAAVGYALYWLAFATLADSVAVATEWGPNSVALVLQWLTWVVAVVQATATMKYLVFKSSGRFWHQVARAYLVYLPAQIVAALVLFTALNVFGLSALIGQLFAVMATTVFSYFGHKYFTFRVSLEG